MRTTFSSERKAIVIGLTAAGALILLSSGAMAQDPTPKSHSLTVMGFNIWNNGVNSKMWDGDEKANGNLVYNRTTQDLLRGVAPDVLVLPELYNNNGKNLNGKSVVGAHVQNTLGLLDSNANKLGPYQKIKDYDTREGSGMIFTSGNAQRLDSDTIRMNPGNGFSDVVIEGRHLNYYDEPTKRIVQAKQLVKAAQGRVLPTIVAGDFNAGDVSERGLLSVDAQIRLMKKASGQNLYAKLAGEYIAAGDEAKSRKVIQDKYANTNIDKLSWKQWADALDEAYARGADTGLKDETYPVADNLPVTLNILRRQYQSMQLERNRELFKPSQKGDGRATWTSDGEDSTNIWESWDRVNIDHIMVSRPFSKWVEIFDNGKWSGTLSEAARLPGGNSLSDHDPVAQQLRWTGPQIQTYKEGEAEKSRLVWGSQAYDFAGRNKEFYLTRNNNRNDVYLGQIADAEGNPILEQLTTDEKKSLLDCKSKDARFQQAVKDYCVDDHSFIAETMATDGGTIIVDEDAALGSAQARLRLANGGLRINGSDMQTLDRKVSLEGPGWFDVTEKGSTVSLRQEVGGEGSMIKRGAGTLVLDAANSYRGGTLVEGGALRAGRAGSFVDNSAFVVNAGQLDLNGFAVKMSSLAGQGGTVSLGGASLEIDQAANTRFDGNIDGIGSLTKSGSGVLVLNGTNTYKGATTIKNGRLIVGDAAHGNASIAGAIDLETGAYLGGIGSVGGLHVGNGSIVAPGNSIGTLNVTGDLTFDAKATYQVEIDPSGNSDRVTVSGDAALGNAQVNVTKAPGSYKEGTRYTILKAHSINGTRFESLIQNMPFINMGLAYDPATVYYDITRNETSFVSMAATRNQRAVAPRVEALASGNAIYDAVVQQEDQGSVRQAFDALSGDVNASTKTALINDSAFLRNTALDRIHAAFDKTSTGNEGSDFTSESALWGQAIGAWSKTKSDGNASGFSQSTGGLLVGYDAAITENWRLGTLAGYSRTSIDFNDRHSSAGSDNYHIGVYGGGQWDATSLKAGLAYSRHRLDTDRSVIFPGFSENLSAGYNAGTFQAFGELSQRFDIQDASIEPFANVAMVRLQTESFREKGGHSALRIEEEATTTTFSTIGIRASAPVDLGEVKTRIGGMLGWQHAYGDIRPLSTAAFSSGDSFGVLGAPVAKDIALINANLDFDVNKQTVFGVQYSGQFGSGFSENAVKAKLSFEF